MILIIVYNILYLPFLLFICAGFWITRDDTTERGGMRAVFGIPLHPDVCSSFGMLGGFLSFPSPVMVAYHGTSKANYASIQQHGLHATHGQLGKGLYIGSFWKACRFAGRDQTYTLRSDPIVLRILWTGTIQVYPSSVACPCSMCSAKPEEKRLTCDHLKVWNNFDAGQLRIGQYSDGKWITQNEEWCVAPSCILRLGEMVDIDPASISGPHYDPTQRTIRIV